MVNILMDDVDEFLMNEVILMCVLEQDCEEWTLAVKFKTELVNEDLHDFLEILGQELL